MTEAANRPGLAPRASSDMGLDPPNVFLFETELAQRWRQSVRTLQRWRQSGTGPSHVRFGRRVLYRMVDVLAHETSAGSGVGGPP